MPLTTLCALIGITGFICFIGAMGWSDEHSGLQEKNGGKKLFLIAFLILIGLLWWLTMFAIQDWRVKKESIFKPVDINGIQIIAVHRENNMRLINLNHKFNRSFPESQKFKVELYERGPYFGLYSSQNANGRINIIPVK